MPIVTTSRRSPRKNSATGPLIIIIAVLAVAVAYLLMRKPVSDENPTSSTDEATVFRKTTKAISTKAGNSAKQAEESKMPASTEVIQASVSIESTIVEGVIEAGQQANLVVEEDKNKPKPMPYGVLSKQYFDNNIENQLEKLGIPGRGVAMILPNRLSQEEILEILRRPIQIFEDDDEDTVAAKERAAAMKTAALKYIEDGGTYDEFVHEMAKTSNEEAELSRTARTEMMRILKTDGYEAAEAYIEEVNPTLKEAGLKEMKIPRPFRVKHQKELERATKGN